VFALLGKSDTTLENPRAYLLRTASHLWIDQIRRAMSAERAATINAVEEIGMSAESVDIDDATTALFQDLHPQERAAIVMKEVLDLSLDETAEILGTTIGAVKSALSRARGRLTGRRPLAGFEAPPRHLVERFAKALSERDIPGIRALC